MGQQPFPTVLIKYGAKKQYATQESKAPLLDAKGKKFIQQVCGKFLFLGRAVDSTLLCPISAIASQSSKPTEDTLKQTKQLLNYIATQEEAVLTYHHSTAPCTVVQAITADGSSCVRTHDVAISRGWRRLRPSQHGALRRRPRHRGGC